jgi:hypothetical protein
MAGKSGVWVYEYDRKYPCKYEVTNVRYVLGEIFDTSIAKALVCIGINPSTAVPEDLDSTLLRVQKYAKENENKEYGAWYMLNVYPQRATNPDDMDKNEDFIPEIHTENLRQIRRLIGSLNAADIWCAWGSNITKRPYLKIFLKDIVKEIQSLNHGNLNFVMQEAEDEKEQPEHPIHPIASIKIKNKLDRFANFKVEEYLEKQIKE